MSSNNDKSCLGRDYKRFVKIYLKKFDSVHLDKILDKYKNDKTKLFNFLVHFHDDDCGSILSLLFNFSRRKINKLSTTFDFYWLDRLYMVYKMKPHQIMDLFTCSDAHGDKFSSYKVINYSLPYSSREDLVELWENVSSEKDLDIFIKRRIYPFFKRPIKYFDILDMFVFVAIHAKSSVNQKFDEVFLIKTVDYLVCWESGKFKNIAPNQKNRSIILNKMRTLANKKKHILDFILKFHFGEVELWNVYYMLVRLGANVNMSIKGLEKRVSMQWNKHFIKLYHHGLDLTKFNEKYMPKDFIYYKNLMRKYFRKWTRYPQYRRNLSVIETIPFVPAVGTEAKSAKEHYETLNN